MDSVNARRAAEMASDYELKELQKGDGTGADKLENWKKLKEEVRHGTFIHSFSRSFQLGPDNDCLRALTLS